MPVVGLAAEDSQTDSPVPQSRGPVILHAHLNDSLDSVGWAGGGPARCLHGAFLEMLDGTGHGLPGETENGSTSDHTGHGLYAFFLHILDSSLSTNPTHSKLAFATKRITILCSCLPHASSCLKPVSIPACRGMHPT